jgi:hypothetical protein
MNCAYHADVDQTAFCIKCGKPLCAPCIRQIGASVYCEPCLADTMNGKTASRSADQKSGGNSPEAAFVLGLIPAVGAIYNAEFFKAAIHMVIFGFLVTLADQSHGPGSGFMHLIAFVFWAYMPFEAYYTAKKRKLALEGVNLETPFDRLNDQLGEFQNKELWGGIILVAIGVLFLLDNFEVVPFSQIQKLWPIIPMGVGILLILRFSQGKSE